MQSTKTYHVWARFHCQHCCATGLLVGTGGVAIVLDGSVSSQGNTKYLSKVRLLCVVTVDWYSAISVFRMTKDGSAG